MSLHAAGSGDSSTATTSATPEDPPVPFLSILCYFLQVLEYEGAMAEYSQGIQWELEWA